MIAPQITLSLIEWFARGPEAGPHPEINRGSTEVSEALAFLLGNGLVNPAGASFAITGRGQAWLQMLLTSPLPVQAWIDPRRHEPGAFADWSPATIAAPRSAGVVIGAPPAPAVAPPIAEPVIETSIDPEILRRAEASLAAGRGGVIVEAPLPEGFTPWDGPTPAPPKDIRHDTFIVAFHRDGTISRQFAGSINWKNRGKRHDVVGYQRADSPDPATPLAMKGV